MMVRYTFLILFFLTFQLNAIAQQNNLTFDGERLPQFGNNSGDLINYLSDSIVYPQHALDEFIEGKVVLKLLISEKGRITSVEIIKSVHPSLDSEAVRVVRSMPTWNPASIGEKHVPFYMTLPISFSLGLKDIDVITEPIDGTETLPYYIGGKATLKRFVYTNLKYPSIASENRIEGIITANLYILADGSIEYIDANNLGWGMIEEAIRIVKLMPKWNPGTRNGVAIKTKVSISIPFMIRK